MTTANQPSVKMTVYGEGAANDADVVFPFDLALPAARDMWKLADSVATSRTGIDRENSNETYWKGPHRDTTTTKVTTYDSSSQSLEAALRALANGIAAAWAAARGQQNRINKARYVQHEESKDEGFLGGIADGVSDFFGGEDDYGPPPDNPATPSGPGFGEPGGARMYPEFGP